MRAPTLFAALFSLLLQVTWGSLVLGQQAAVSPSPDHEHPQLTALPDSVLHAELKSARRGTFKLSDYSSNVLVINLWATWLGPSRLEVPALVKLQNEFWSQGVRVVGLSTENPTGSAREVREFARDFRIQYKIGWAPSDVSIILMQGRDALPQTYVISPSGRIVRRFIGFNPQQTPSQFKLAIKEALNEKPDTPQPPR